jgi:hypothetical protein
VISWPGQAIHKHQTFSPEGTVSQLTLESLERRVAALERELAHWAQHQQQPVRWKDWRQALGQFTPSELSLQIDAAGRDIREADRRRADQ